MALYVIQIPKIATTTPTIAIITPMPAKSPDERKRSADESEWDVALAGDVCCRFTGDCWSCVVEYSEIVWIGEANVEIIKTKRVRKIDLEAKRKIA